MNSDLDELVRRADHGDSIAADHLFATLYDELHRLAEIHLRRADSGLSLGTTTLLHEAYLNIAGRAPSEGALDNRARFLAYASRAMRNLVIDYARRRRARKRGRDIEITLSDDEQPTADATRTLESLESLDDALNALANVDAALAELVDLHFFSGFSFAEIASIRDVSERTVQRDWRKARLLLQHTLTE